MGGGLEAVPQAPGVFQLRIEHGLLSYPRGKSAMVAYGAGAELRGAVQAFLRSAAGERARAHGKLLLRWAVLPAGAQADAALTRLRGRFVSQFGSCPVADSDEAAEG